MKEQDVLKKVMHILEERNWSLYRLSKESDISYSTLNNTVQRNNVPSIPTLMRLCEGLGITMSEFFAEDGMEVKQLSDVDRQLLREFHCLPREDKKLLNVYISGLLASDAEDEAEKN